MNKSKFDSFEDKTIFVKGSNQEITPWDRTKIIAILMDESGLPFSVAEKIAEDVQKIVFSSNLKTVSSSLLRELVNSKLIEYGYSKILNKTRRLGLSTSDVKEVISNAMPYKTYAPVSPMLSSNYIAETVKRQFSAFNIFPEKIVNLHYEGKIHINGINGIDRLYSVALDVSKLLTFKYAGDNFFVNKPNNVKDFFENLIKTLLFLNNFVNSSIFIFGIEKVFKYFKVTEEGADFFIDFLKHVESLFLSDKPLKIFLKDKNLMVKAARFYSQNFCLKSEIATKKASYVPSRNISISDSFVDNSYFVMENVTLNLPGIALQAKLKSKDFFKELKTYLESAFIVFGKKGIFIEKMLMTKGQSVLDFLKKLGFNPLASYNTISICGLQECISLLKEKHKFNGEDLTFANDIFVFLKESIENLKEKYKFNVLISDSDQTDTAYRFARLDLKFEPYYIGKVVKGDISYGGIFYSHNASFLSNPYFDIYEAIDVEENLKKYFDFPFKTVVKLLDFDNVKISLRDRGYRYLMLTQDFSVCYHCTVMKSGIYKSCPECLSDEVFNYFYLYSNYAPFSKLNRGLRVMMDNIVYYEEFTI
ncbi:hypothetical protein TTHT_0019 [Thermotomaculum hydrothermale]|uniref:Uncharacterized protein n=1 Tax=Thermotomaculum hydrothermale TaxID=981385 RepID=A0A7R6PLB1_9BACT|nr:anaerobic ribonucleoside-triphosphate reductase [Thermotomaculum hydrothermale]BBB31673.1 hypothetical protein TTHT_0019 [Thermotomaculum hydrothermale]